MNNIIDLNSKEDAKELCQGLILDKRVSYEMMSDTNIFDAAEVLLVLNDSHNLTSKAELLSRALNYGWTPVDYEEEESKAVEGELSEKVGGERESRSEMIKAIVVGIPVLALIVLCAHSTMFLTLRSFVPSPEEEKKQEMSLVMEILLHLGAAIFLGGGVLVIAFDENKQ